ncbi:pseudouridine synthase [Phosphitispora sp. TUW77]|uniref:pseudouridine synthase n=1 Tax=Phosphitispora sp. TUW77 TaxID=3152361 RepID=UPI003AB8464C
MERLQKYLARAGVASRRSCEELIARGMVKVNGEIVTEMGVKIDPDNDKIQVRGKLITKPEKKVYLMLNKPKGYVTTLKDPQGRPKVTDLLTGIEQRVYPVGRLDFDTEGLLLLTNDGDVTYGLTHPKHELGKTYVVTVKGVPDRDKLNRFAKGLRLADGITAPAKVRLVRKKGNNGVLEITIYEGRNRQIRRMCETVGHPVLELKRVSMGFLRLDGLEEGKFRHLTKEEISKLIKSVK